MAYLSCPNCGTTYFDRNPLTAPHRCPRCASNFGKSVELKRSERRGGAAASLLRSPPGQTRPTERPPGDGDADR